jgi:hypothetical protein
MTGMISDDFERSVCPERSFYVHTVTIPFEQLKKFSHPEISIQICPLVLMAGERF